MKITFLGTGTSQGVPMIGCRCMICQSADNHDKRLRSSILVEHKGQAIVIDSGPDFRYQMLRSKVDRLDAIIFTHEHKDHTGGLDDVRAYNYTQQKAMDIYGENRVIEVLRKDFDYAFSKSPYPGVPEIKTHIIKPYEPFAIGDTTIIPIRGYHHKLPVLGFRIDDFCYLTDLNHLDQKAMDSLQGVDTLVITALRHRKHLSHYSLDESLDIISRLKPRRSYLTHISHQLGLHRRIEETLPQGVHLAYDTLEI